jgi:hypothetical protein
LIPQPYQDSANQKDWPNLESMPAFIERINAEEKK